jgi:hypothetical protein
MVLIALTVASPFFHEQEAKEGNIKRIRAGEVAATAIVVGTGWAVAARSVGNIALWASIAISAVFVAGYEFQIAHPSKPDKGELPSNAGPGGLEWWKAR